MSRLNLTILPAIFAILLMAGCNQGHDNIAPVSGTVTLDGQPAPNVMVTFVPEGGGAASTGVTDASGNYTLTYIDSKGALIGKHRVSVTSVASAGSASSAPTNVSSDDPNYANRAQGDYAAMSAQQSAKEVIPERYNTNSELVKEVTAGENVINLELTTK
jgi:hypothetical protein